MMDQMTLREVREALAVSRPGEGTAPITPVVAELEALGRALRGAPSTAAGATGGSDSAHSDPTKFSA